MLVWFVGIVVVVGIWGVGSGVLGFLFDVVVFKELCVFGVFGVDVIVYWVVFDLLVFG